MSGVVRLYFVGFIRYSLSSFQSWCNNDSLFVVIILPYSLAVCTRISDPYPSSKLITPHTASPAPSAITSVYNVLTAEIKNSISIPPIKLIWIKELPIWAAGQIGPCWPDLWKRTQAVRNATVEDVLVLALGGVRLDTSHVIRKLYHFEPIARSII